jgi:DNA-directed RNA polymerase subunit RPC12/RpoP
MRAIKIIAFIVAGILIFFGVLFIWGAFSPQGSTGWIGVGIITVGIGLALIYFGSQVKAKAGDTNVTLNIDLPADVKMDSFKCQSCGGALTMENIQMVAGAPVVNCPYCKSVYQLKEEPKW